LEHKYKQKQERSASLQIDNLRIRLPAGSRGAAESIAREAIDGLASALPSVTGDHHLGHARLRIRVPAGASNSEISAAIQAAIARSIAP